MTIRKKIYTIAAAILPGLAAVSCASDSSDAPDNGQPVNVGISITAKPQGVNTRAFLPGELTEDPASSSELINNWIVFFTQGNQVISYEEGGSNIGVWNDRVQTELPRGRYTVIAFANMNNEKLKEYFKEGQTLPLNWQDLINDEKNGGAGADLSQFSQFSYNSQNSQNQGQDQNRPLIPMSGYQEINVTQTVNETFSIEVVRMLAKVQFAFKNESQSAISIEKIEFQPVYNGDVYLFPATTFPIENRFTEGVYPVPDKYEMRTVTPNLSLTNFNDIARSTFYVKESVAKGNHPTDHFHIGISLKRDGTIENATYALADDALESIVRNDYILFPIVISDYIPQLEVYDYPPIGGYPVQVESYGNEFYATFSSSGAFDIEARLVNSRGETVVVNNQPNASRDYVSCTIPDAIRNDLTLTYDAIEGRWHGDIDIKKVQMPIIITFDFHIGDLAYTRTLHLLSK